MSCYTWDNIYKYFRLTALIAGLITALCTIFGHSAMGAGLDMELNMQSVWDSAFPDQTSPWEDSYNFNSAEKCDAYDRDPEHNPEPSDKDRERADTYHEDHFA